MKQLTLQEILEQLQLWSDNTMSDIQSDWIEDETRQEFICDRIMLSQCIGMLKTLNEGNNNNINR